jgi:hypothetical protein
MIACLRKYDGISIEQLKAVLEEHKSALATPPFSRSDGIDHRGIIDDIHAVLFLRSQSERQAELASPRPGEVWQYFDGRRYRVLLLARDHETLEEIVVCEALYDNLESKFWIFSSKIFVGQVKVGSRETPYFKRV